jgi:glutamate-1-semialdehyde 2,1-aminomutase
MAAGIAQLLILRELMPYDDIEAQGHRLLDAMSATAAEVGIPFWGNVLGGMWGFHFAEGPVESFEQARTSDADYFARFFWAALERGVFFPPSPYEAAFLSTAHDDAVIDFTIEQVQLAMKEAVK